MATFEKILEDGLLVPVTVKLGRGRFYDRKLYAYPECHRWMRQDVPRMVTGRIQSAQTPAQQLILRLAQWLSGDSINSGLMFRELKYPRDHDVWELKTDDLRIFGWMYQSKQFIAAVGRYTDDYKEPTKIRNYADDVRAVATARDALPLEGTKFVRGKFDELV